MNNKQNDLVRRAMEKIRRDEKCKPDCYGVIGATARFNKSSNKIIHNFKQIPFKYK